MSQKVHILARFGKFAKFILKETRLKMYQSKQNFTQTNLSFHHKQVVVHVKPISILWVGISNFLRKFPSYS